uniref:LIM zinc-binding domain-containing protein n=1 Tax=Romanomermis culicivorax TaxID=13658 RepID=A0A915JZ69_ROMCU
MAEKSVLPECYLCKKKITEIKYQRVYRPDGLFVPYHVTCFVCMGCNTIIKDEYIFDTINSYHRCCFWKKVANDAAKKQASDKPK